MELKQRLNLRKVLIAGYFVALAIYLGFGLIPAGAARTYDVSAELDIPSIGLTTDVTALRLNSDNALDTPDTIVGSYAQAENKTLLIGHSSTVFHDLKYVKIGDEIMYNNKSYQVTTLNLTVKPEIDMREVLAPAEEDTIIIMTCDGMALTNGDATHRFMVTAVEK